MNTNEKGGKRKPTLREERDQFEQENIALKVRLDDTLKLDEAYRSELAQALGLKDAPMSVISARHGTYDDMRPLQPGRIYQTDVSSQPAPPPSWSQLFMHVGRLREIKSRIERLDFFEELKKRGEEVLGRLEERDQREQMEDEHDRRRRRGEY